MHGHDSPTFFPHKNIRHDMRMPYFRLLRFHRDQLKLAEASNCVALNRVDYTKLVDDTLQQARCKLGINENKIRASYQTEKTLYPDSKASRRLLV